MRSPDRSIPDAVSPPVHPDLALQRFFQAFSRWVLQFLWVVAVSGSLPRRNNGVNSGSQHPRQMPSEERFSRACGGVVLLRTWLSSKSQYTKRAFDSSGVNLLRFCYTPSRRVPLRSMTRWSIEGMARITFAKTQSRFCRSEMHGGAFAPAGRRNRYVPQTPP